MTQLVTRTTQLVTRTTQLITRTTQLITRIYSSSHEHLIVKAPFASVRTATVFFRLFTGY